MWFVIPNTMRGVKVISAIIATAGRMAGVCDEYKMAPVDSILVDVVSAMCIEFPEFEEHFRFGCIRDDLAHHLTFQTSPDGEKAIIRPPDASMVIYAKSSDIK
jgi:hypothetical protein